MVSVIQGGALFLGGRLIQDSDKDFGDLSTWVFLAVFQPIISVVLGSIWRPLEERPNYWSSFIQEGASQTGVLCIWWVRTSFFILRPHQGFDIDPIYSLAYSSKGLVAFDNKA
jgi:hypothetical protein